MNGNTIFYLYLLRRPSFVVVDYAKQEYSKEAVAHVQKYLMKNEVPVNLFEVSNMI